ncbi:MAG: hypothetical protein WAM96_18700 [Candidatus Acidiferrales bacterium]
MKRRVGILAAILMAGLLALGWHLFGPQRVPAGQPPLTSLASDNFDKLREKFNADSGKVRVVLLLSPT